MKHITCVTRKPEKASATIEAIVDFFVNLTEQVITFFFQKNGGSL